EEEREAGPALAGAHGEDQDADPRHEEQAYARDPPLARGAGAEDQLIGLGTDLPNERGERTPHPGRARDRHRARDRPGRRQRVPGGSQPGRRVRGGSPPPPERLVTLTTAHERRWARRGLDVEPEVHAVAVADDVLLALDAQESLFPDGGLAPQPDQVLPVE